MKKHPSLLIALFAAILIALSCNKDEKAGSVTLNFDHEVAGEALVLNQFQYVSQAGHPYSVINLRYYVSDFTLVRDNGETYTTSFVHYRDIHDELTRSLVLENVPPGNYTGIRFVFGLDEATNVDGGLPNTLVNINMEWPLPGDFGYHYMKFEGRYDSLGSGVIKNYNLHTGATGGNQNFISHDLNIPVLSVDDNSWDLNLIMDLNEWLQNPHVYDFEEFGPMIMANQNAQELLKANGQTTFRAERVAN